MRVPPRILLLAAPALLAACGQSGSHGQPPTFSAHGISFAYPAPWQATATPLSNGAEPVYRFAVGNFRFHRTGRDLGPCLLGIARQRPANGVLAFMREALGTDARRARPRTPARPAPIPLPRASDQAGCLGHGTEEVNFHEGDRVFYLWVSVGPDASRRDKTRLRNLLNSLTIGSDQ